MITQYGIRFHCDLCGAEAESPVPPPGFIKLADMPRPGGWTNLYPLGIEIRDVYARVVNDLCGTCAALTVAELAAAFKARAEAERSADGTL